MVVIIGVWLENWGLEDGIETREALDNGDSI